MRNGLGNLSEKKKLFSPFTNTHVNCAGCVPSVGVRLSYDSAQWNVNEGSYNEMSGNILDFH